MPEETKIEILCSCTLDEYCDPKYDKLNSGEELIGFTCSSIPLRTVDYFDDCSENCAST